MAPELYLVVRHCAWFDTFISFCTAMRWTCWWVHVPELLFVKALALNYTLRHLRRNCLFTLNLVLGHGLQLWRSPAGAVSAAAASAAKPRC